MTVRSSLTPALPWVAAGLAFAAYPALRPWTDETTMAGLRAMASQRWVLAHLLGMAGFVLLSVGIGSWSLRDGPATRVRRLLPWLAGLAVVLLLPYYGGEAFALRAIGRYAVAHDDLGMLAVVDGFRYQPLAMVVFGIGLLSLAAVGIVLVVDTWSAGPRLRVAAVTVGLALALYLPQFYTPAAVRVGHGIVLGLGCVAFGLLSRPERRATDSVIEVQSERLVQL